MKGKATTIKKTFSRATKISIDINADQERVWNILTNSGDYPRWNSTVNDLKGNIELGGKLELKSILDDKRTFKLKVKEFNPSKHMRWGDAMGNRDYTVEPNGSHGVTFIMEEKIGGPLFPLFSRMIPDFDESFEMFAKDLKAEAEKL